MAELLFAIVLIYYYTTRSILVLLCVVLFKQLEKILLFGRYISIVAQSFTTSYGTILIFFHSYLEYHFLWSDHKINLGDQKGILYNTTQTSSKAIQVYHKPFSF